MFLFLAVMTSSNPATDAAVIAVPIAVVVFFIVVIVIIILVYVMYHRRHSKSVSMSVSDKPLPVRNNSYAPAESTVTTNIDSGGKDKRDSTFEEFPDQCYPEDSGRNSEDCFI